MRAFDRFAKPKILSFTIFLDRLLAMRNTSGIKKFRLVCDHLIDPRCLNNWLPALHSVQELDLEICQLLEFPWSLLVNNSLEILKLRCDISVSIPSSVSFPRLKILHLHSVTYLGDASVKNLLSCSPVLEDLQISRSKKDNVRNFVIAVPSLKKLTLDFLTNETELYDSDDYANAVEHKLTIAAPKLEYLSLYDCMSDSIQFTPMASVTESRVAVRKILEIDDRTAEQISDYGRKVYDIFQSIPNVKRLTIGEFTMESMAESLDRKLPMFHNLAHLEISLDGVNGAMLLPDLLQASPKLESLILPQGITSPDQVGFDPDENLVISYSWKPPNNVPECLLFSLKNVEIRRITGRVEEELERLKYFLENAMVMEKITICYEEYEVSGGPMDTTNYPTSRRLDDRLSFIDKLKNCKRGSAACQLDIQMPELPYQSDL